MYSISAVGGMLAALAISLALSGCGPSPPSPKPTQSLATALLTHDEINRVFSRPGDNGTPTFTSREPVIDTPDPIGPVTADCVGALVVGNSTIFSDGLREFRFTMDIGVNNMSLTQTAGLFDSDTAARRAFQRVEAALHECDPAVYRLSDSPAGALRWTEHRPRDPRAPVDRSDPSYEVRLDGKALIEVRYMGYAQPSEVQPKLTTIADRIADRLKRRSG